MTKKKKSEAMLQKLCTSKGAITNFQKNMSKLLNESAKEKDYPKALLEMIILVTCFQDKHMKKLTEIKEGLKVENPDLFGKFGRFYATIKICGRDHYKVQKHHSFVSNQALVKKFKIGKTIRFTPTETTIYLSSEFNRIALSLKHFKELKSKKHMGEFHDRMVEDIVLEAKNFIKNHGKTFCEPLFQ
jgi:hypothetical protein